MHLFIGNFKLKCPKCLKYKITINKKRLSHCEFPGICNDCENSILIKKYGRRLFNVNKEKCQKKDQSF